MDFDINGLIAKLEGLSLSKNNKKDINLSEEEKNFMGNIFNTILNSDNQETIIEYLAGIYGRSTSDIYFIKNMYFYLLASKEEQLEYSKIKKEKTKARRKEGFIDTTAMISITIFFSVIGLTIALILYNLM